MIRRSTIEKRVLSGEEWNGIIAQTGKRIRIKMMRGVVLVSKGDGWESIENFETNFKAFTGIVPKYEEIQEIKKTGKSFTVRDLNRNGMIVSRHRTENSAREAIRLMRYRNRRDTTTPMHMRRFLYRADYQVYDPNGILVPRSIDPALVGEPIKG